MGIQYWQTKHNWRWSYDNYFSPAVMSEIKNALHADYIRTGFIPDWLQTEQVAWRREDRIMDNACNAGLSVMVIVPTGDDRLGVDDLGATVRAFFARYTARERGCGIIAEIGNEENLRMSPGAYAKIFELLAPEIRELGVAVVTAGTSGLDDRWTRGVSDSIAGWCPAEDRIAGTCSLPSAYALHPYNIAPNRMQSTIERMASSLDRAGSGIYITEYGSDNPKTLAGAIEALAAQPAVTVYEYKCQPTDDSCKYGLKGNPSLYGAVQNAFAYVQAHRADSATSPFSTVSPMPEGSPLAP